VSTKKIIGTIIGVIAFIAVIAGATFAWLVIQANVINNVINNATSKDFIITYAGSAAIKNPKQLASGNAKTSSITSASAASTADDAWAAVTASKTANSAAAGSFKLKLAISSNSLTTNSMVYAVCKGPCPTDVALATISDGTATCASGVSKCGLITAGSVSDVVLFNDTSTFNTNAKVDNVTYNIYFWLNANTIDVLDLGKGMNGYIYAEASQVNS